MIETFVDARGLKCPWPVLKLVKAMRTAECVHIVADDPQAAAEFRALADERGWRLTAADTGFRVSRADNLLTESCA